jgi:hypothetical protein
MSDITPDVLRSIREILRIGNELREYRTKERRLEHERAKHRENVLTHYSGPVRFVTPYGNVVIRNRHSSTKFSLEDIRAVLQSAEDIPEDVRTRIQARFDEEADKHTKTTRTLTVQRQQTLKTRRHNRRNKSQTLRRDEHTD